MNWYTVYSNIDASMNVGDNVAAGQEIGQLRHSLSSSTHTSSPYLHFEVRLSSPCTIEQKHCNTIGHDPHVHPLILSPIINGPEYDRPKMNIISDIGPSSDGIIEIITPLSQPNINNYKIEIIGKNKKTKKEFILDYTTQFGFDKSLLFQYDNNVGDNNYKLQYVPDTSNPYLLPLPSSSNSSNSNNIQNDNDNNWKIQLVIPSTWVQYKESYDFFRLTVENIWGKETYLSFTSDVRSWSFVEK